MADHSLISSLLKPLYRKGRSAVFRLPEALGDKPRILCLDPGDLSEVVFHLPLLNALRTKHPGARIEFLLPEHHADLVVPSGLTKHCLLYKEGQLSPWRPSFASLLKQLGGQDYDLSIVMSHTARPRLELAALAAGAALRLGPSHADSWPAVNCELRFPLEDETYLGDRVRRLAPFLGLQPGTMGTAWPLPQDKLRHTAQQIHFHKPNPDQLLIGFDPGPGKSGHAFALENLEFLVRQLTSQMVCTIIPVGDPADKDRLAGFSSRISQVPVGLARETLLDMVLLVSQCDLFLGGNTDMFHLAVAQGIPSVGLFGQADGRQWVPSGRANAQVLRLAPGEKVDVATLMETVEKVVGRRLHGATTVIPPDAVRPVPEPDSPPRTGP